jgi:IS30 family transposase
MEKLKHGKDSNELATTVIRILTPFKNCIHSITTDNGCEFAAHRRISEAIGANVYFTDSYSSWQKGAIENANGLIRQYIPKGMPFKYFTDGQIERIQDKINSRPRKKLSFDSPNERFDKNIAKCKRMKSESTNFATNTNLKYEKREF